MGNFSVSHYAKLQPSAKGVELQYVLDLAEIPTFQMLNDWKIDRSASQAELESHASAQARLWLNNLDISVDGRTVHPKIESVKAVIADGAGNLPILRIPPAPILTHKAANSHTKIAITPNAPVGKKSL